MWNFLLIFDVRFGDLVNFYAEAELLMFLTIPFYHTATASPLLNKKSNCQLSHHLAYIVMRHGDTK